VSSPFFGLDIASRALRTEQTLVDVTNQNVANVNTPGYTRQDAVVKATLPYPIPVFQMAGTPGQLGTGVEVAEVNRARDQFTDYQYRNQVASQGNWDAQNTALQQIEAVVNEPSSTSLSTVMSTYWQSWQEVANSPSDVSVRANLLEQGTAVAQTFQSTAQHLLQQQRDVDTQIKLSVDDINNYATQIANLNVQISQVESGGMKANDLRDQRDVLVDKLAQNIKISTVENPDGEESIYVGGHQLVDRNTAHAMGLDTTSGPFARVVWKDTSATPAPSVTVADGKLAGLIFMRDGVPAGSPPNPMTTEGIQGRINALNDLASRLIQSVNAVHAAGVGIDGTSGLNFFSGKDATDIAVDPSLTADHIAAARMTGTGSQYSHAAGDSSNAIALAQIQNALSQRSTGLTNGQTVGSATVKGVDVGHASVNTAFTVSVSAGSPPTVTLSDGTNTRTASYTVASNTADGTAPAQDIYTIDTGSAGVNDPGLGMGLGVRITIAVAHGTTAAAALANLNGQTVATQGPTTLADQYAQEIASIGVKASTAQSQANNQQVMVTHLDNQRQQSGGVSLDEEATKLVQYQRAYEAAAHVVTVVDSMLDTLINHTGVG
jgi:flagellar hook-associated protein 1